MSRRRPIPIAAALAAILSTAIPLGVQFAAADTVANSTPLALPAAGCIQNFDTLATVDGNTLPPGAVFDESGTNANGTYAAGNGSSNTGNTYSLGASGGPERAFGGLLSGSLTPTLGMLVRNETGATMTSLVVTYTLEQWRQGGTSRFDRLDFSYSTSSTSITSGSFTDVDALDGIAPQGASATGPHDGNAAANRVVTSSTISGLSVPVNGTVMLRWSDFNAAGADDALGVDDLKVVANGGATPTAACPGGGGTGPVDPGAATLISAIQGAGATSSMLGARTIEAIVTGLDDEAGSGFGTGNNITLYPADRGFFLQEEVADQDANPSTSEGIFVGLPSGGALPAIGDEVRLTGTVKDGQAASAFGQTRIETTSYTVVSSGNPLPPAVVIDASLANSQSIGAETNPTRSYYEMLEGMLVTVPSGVAQSGGTNKFGELFILPAPHRARCSEPIRSSRH